MSAAMPFPESLPKGASERTIDYAQLLADARQDEVPGIEVAPKSDIEPLPMAAYEYFARKISKQFTESVAAHEPARDRVAALRAEFLHVPDTDPRLERFAAVAIDAPQMAQIQSYLDRQQALGQRSEQDKQLTYRQCEYNDEVRLMLLEGQDTFTRAQITELLEQATKGHATKYLHREINAMIAEISLAEVLSSMPGMADVVYSEPEDDFHSGIDIMAHYYGQLVGFDAKASGPTKAGTTKTRLRGSLIPKITLNIPPEDIGEIGPNTLGAKRTERRINGLLATANVGQNRRP